MKAKRFIIHAVLAVFILSCVFFPGEVTAQKEEEQEKKEEVKEEISIPQPVKDVLAEGLEDRTGRKDIPVTITRHLCFPARQNVQIIFLFELTNGDLGFAPILLEPAEAIDVKGIEEEKKEKKELAEEKEEEQVEETEERLYASFDVFLQFHRLQDKNPVGLVKEVDIPVNLSEDVSAYEPEKKELYSTAYPLPPGDYLLAMAVTSLDFQKIGTTYYEFSVPDLQAQFVDLNTTHIFFVQEINRMSSPELTAEVHKDFFRWSLLKIEPKKKRVFTQGEYLDIFFYIIGAQPNEEGKFNIEISYEVYDEEGNIAIRYEKQKYASPMISQPIRMKQTVIIKRGGKEVRREIRDLKPGLYSLSINITDNISSKTLNKEVDFKVKEKEQS